MEKWIKMLSKDKVFGIVEDKPEEKTLSSIIIDRKQLERVLKALKLFDIQFVTLQVKSAGNQILVFKQEPECSVGVAVAEYIK